MAREKSAEALFQYGKFDVHALCGLASELRNGLSCSCDVNKLPASGSFNWAATIEFEDGVEWILRSPKDQHRQFPHNVSVKLLSSEAATLKYLGAHTDIPVPTVYAYCATPDNDLGIPFILMSKARGWSLDKVWKSAPAKSALSPAEKAKVVFQLGQVAWKLGQVRFDQIGSLFEKNGTFVVGECLSRAHILHQRYSLEEIARGPFANEREFYNSLISAFTIHAETLPMTHHCFAAPLPSTSDFETYEDYGKACDLWNDFVAVGAKIDTATNRLDYIIAGDALHDLINLKTQTWPVITLASPFALHHPDLSVNNIFVDDDYNITGIIDWSFSTAAPLSWLLTPPGLPQSRNPLEADLLLAFQNGYEEASHTTSYTIPEHRSDDEEFLAYAAISFLKDSRFVWSLSRLLAFDSTDDLSLFQTLWKAVHSFDSQELEAYMSAKRALPHYQRLYGEVRSEDQSIAQVQKLEAESFTRHTVDLPLARYLTLMSQWNFQYDPPFPSHFRQARPMFIAEPRLWRWVNKFKESRL